MRRTPAGLGAGWPGPSGRVVLVPPAPGTARSPPGHEANVVDGGAKWSTVAQSGGWAEPGGGARMFVGSYTPKLDEKNRLFLPAKFREQLAEGLVVTKGQDFCLNVFPRADFAEMTGRIQEAPLTVRQAREYGRFLAMRAAEDKPDKQGRITIPPLLKEYAGLDRDVVVIGALNRVEIWDPERIAAWEAEHSQTFADMSEDILPAT